MNVAALLLLLALASAVPAVEDEASPWPERLRAWSAAAEIPGVQAAVLADGEVAWSGAVGLARLAGGDVERAPLSDVTPLPAASLAKPVFAVVVLKLVEEERLALDAPVTSLLPPGARRWLPDDPRFEGVTVRRLLSHTAGLAPGGRPVLVLDPGARFSYSGLGYDLLQRVVESRTGESLEVLATRIVFDPAGMTRSTFTAGTRAPVAPELSGYDRFGEAIPFQDPPRSYASFTLRTTAADYARFLAALVAGDLLSDESVALLFTPATPVERRITYEPGAASEAVEGVTWSLGFGLEERADATVAFLWGSHPGYRAWVAFDPEVGDGVVWLANSSDGFVLRSALVGAVLPGEHAAHAWIETATHDDPAVALSRRLGRVARDDGIDAARALFATWTEDPALAPLLAPEERLVGETGQLLQLSGRSASAVELLAWNAELSPDDPWAHENLARVLLFSRRTDEGLAALRRCLELDPSNRFAYDTLQRADSH